MKRYGRDEEGDQPARAAHHRYSAGLVNAVGLKLVRRKIYVAMHKTEAI
jgi:hypothetical protein